MYSIKNILSDPAASLDTIKATISEMFAERMYGDRAQKITEAFLESIKFAKNNSEIAFKTNVFFNDINQLMLDIEMEKIMEQRGNLLMNFMKKASYIDKLTYFAQQTILERNPDLNLKGKDLFVIEEEKSMLGFKSNYVLRKVTVHDDILAKDVF